MQHFSGNRQHPWILEKRWDVDKGLSKRYSFHYKNIFKRQSRKSIWSDREKSKRDAIFVSWKTGCNYDSWEKSRFLAHLFSLCNISIIVWHSFCFTKNLKSPQPLWVLGLEKERLFLFSLKPMAGGIAKSSVCCFSRYITLLTATNTFCSFWRKGEHQKILGVWSWVQHSIKHTF